MAAIGDVWADGVWATGVWADGVWFKTAVATTAVAAKGGWLSSEQVAQLRKIIASAERKEENESRRKGKRRAKRLAELEALYDTVTGVLPPDTIEAVSEAVRPFSEASDAPLPPVQAVDWASLLASMEAVQALSNAILEASRMRQEDEMMEILMWVV